MKAHSLYCSAVFHYSYFFYSGFAASMNWCIGRKCTNKEQPINWDRPDFYPIHPTTTDSTTSPKGCFYNGRYFPQDTKIENRRDPGNDWCRAVFCDSTGNIRHGDGLQCSPPTTAQVPKPRRRNQPIPTLAPTTPTPPPGCYYQGHYYPANTKIQGDKCSYVMCDYSGTILYGDNPNCFTLPTTNEIPTPIPVCYYNGHYYPANTRIQANQCSAVFCDSTGGILHGDNTNCFTPPTTTAPTPAPTPALGCYYNSHYYHPNTKIEEGRDPDSHWCWVVLCDSTGNIIHGDDFNCYLSSSAQSTIPPSLTDQPVVNVIGK